MKNLCFIYALLFISNFIFAQYPCGVLKEHPSVEQARQESILRIKKKKSNFRTIPINTVYLPIKVHRIAKNDGTDFISDVNLNIMLANLNKTYLPINIQFYFSGTTFSTYSNDRLYDGVPSMNEYETFHVANGVKNAVNLYISKDVYLNGNLAGGFAFYTPRSSLYNRLYIRSSQATDTKTTEHEFGHYFSLYHTFENSTDVNFTELVTRNFNELLPRKSANCKVAGDYCCDTPSDPRGIANATMFGCTYTGTAKDSNGDSYFPAVDNIMDYNFCFPNKFTPEQYQRIVDGFYYIDENKFSFDFSAPETIQNPPSDVQITKMSNFFRITWKDNSTTETGYILEVANSAFDKFIPIGGTEKNITSFDYYGDISKPLFCRIKPSNSKNNYSLKTETISLVGTATTNGNYEYDYYLTSSDGINFLLPEIFLCSDGTVKFRKDSTWETNWGSATFPTGKGIQNGIEIPVKDFGYYSVSFNKTTGNYSFQKLNKTLPSYGILGTAVNNSWEIDVDLTTLNGRVYLLKNYTLKQGEAKFRQDNSWDNNWGNTSFPNGIGIWHNDGNIPITQGIYTISFNPHTREYNFESSLSTENLSYKNEDNLFYPNPVTNQINFYENLKSIQVFSLTGSLVFESKENKTSYDVSSLKKGVYLIYGETTSGKRINQKFTKL